jgi:hypothetical protein
MPRANSQCLSVLQKEGHNERLFAVGRANWIHIGNEQAGPRVAAILSVVESCRRLKIPIRNYLADILPGLANASIQRIADITPAAWAAKHPELSSCVCSDAHP